MDGTPFTASYFGKKFQGRIAVLEMKTLTKYFLCNNMVGNNTPNLKMNLRHGFRFAINIDNGTEYDLSNIYIVHKAGGSWYSFSSNTCLIKGFKIHDQDDNIQPIKSKRITNSANGYLIKIHPGFVHYGYANEYRFSNDKIREIVQHLID